MGEVILTFAVVEMVRVVSQYHEPYLIGKKGIRDKILYVFGST